eukprot:g898.t1
MTTIGFTDDEQHNTFTLVSFIMHLSLVDFEQGDSGDDSRISSASIKVATCAASLLGIRMGEFEAGLCKKSYVDPQKKSSIDIPVDVGPAKASRDALAKMLYELLFLWLVKRINDAIIVPSAFNPRRKGTLSQQTEASFIGVLDIFGFETFETNSFEQLCVNYANEKLQQQFNESMFKVQQEEYQKEQIKWQGVADFPDNSQCISLIEGTGRFKPGIIGTLSAACAPFTRGETPGEGADNSFAEKLYKHLEGKTNRFVTNHRMKGWKQFGVVHYAGLVKYTSHGFIRKNMDLVSSRCRDMIQTATLPIVAEIFSSWYVRCIKPNDDNVPNRLEESRLLQQLRYGGVLEAVRVAREGYPCRVEHSEFITKFSSMRNSMAHSSHSEANQDSAGVSENRSSRTSQECRRILEDAGLTDKAQCQVGLTKVFMRQECYDFIEAWRWKRMNAAAIKMQAYYRGAVQHKEYCRWRLVLIRAVVRIRLWIKRRRKRLAREKWALEVMSRALSEWREKRIIRAAQRTIYALFKGRRVKASIQRRKIDRMRQAEEDAKLINQLNRTKEELARALERIAHLEQAIEAGVAASAMANSAVAPTLSLDSAEPMDVDLVNKNEELRAMNERLLQEQAQLHKLVAGKVEVNAQLAMYITELADELEEVKLFRDALLVEGGDEVSDQSLILLTEEGTEKFQSTCAKKKTLNEKMIEISEQLGLSSSLPLLDRVAAANKLMGIKPSGRMMQQVDELMAQLGLN